MSAPTLPLDSAARPASHPSGAAIVFDKVALSFGNNHVLRDVSFHLPFGEPKHCSAWQAPGKAQS